uniref:Integrase core domain containing protein n=1 Tax=Solanum tuberosum TaxID=4113 RepID=M1E0F9_SOLTU
MVTKKRSVSFKDDDRLQHYSTIAIRVESETEVQIEERLGVEALAVVMMNFDSDCIEEYDQLVAALDRCEYQSKPKKYELDMKNPGHSATLVGITYQLGDSPFFWFIAFCGLPSACLCPRSLGSISLLCETVRRHVDCAFHRLFDLLPSRLRVLEQRAEDAKQNLQKQVWCRGLRTPVMARKLTYRPSMSTVDPRYYGTQEASHLYKIGSENGSTSGSEFTHASGSESSHASGYESAHAEGSIAKSATGFGENEQAASSDETTSSESIPSPWNGEPTPMASEPNRCRFLYSPTTSHSCPLNTTKFDYRWDVMRGGAFQGNAEKWEAITLWLSKHITADAPDTDLSSIRAELASLRADVDAILEIPANEIEHAPMVLSEDTILDALFRVDAETQPDPTRARGKRHHSSHHSETVDDAQTRKRERKEEEQARRASILDEELHQKRALEAAAGASSFVPVRIDMSTTMV